MNNIEVEKLDIKKTHQHLIDGDFSAVELAKVCLKNIEEKNPEINAYLEIYDDVLEQAKRADEKIKSRKDVNVLTGIPMSLKDNILNEGKRTGAASKILENYTAVYDATVVKKLKEKGVVFLGRANMDEFAMGSSTENSAYSVVKNPHDTDRVAGGSSGGSVASVAMNSVLVSFGSDTAGSVRQPASFCGVVGLKPTYGSISRYGLIPLSQSFDQIGPIGKTVDDVEVLFNAIAEYDSMDSTSLPKDKRIAKDVKEKLTIGVPMHFMKKGIDKDVFEKFNESLEKLKSLGHSVKEITLSNVKYALAVYYIIMPAEASTNLARFDGVKYGLHMEGDNLLDDYIKTRSEGFGEEVRRRIILGTHILSAGYYDAYYNKANAVRALIKADFENAFSEANDGVDIIMTPTSPTPAFKIGEKKDPLSMYLSDIFTVQANLTGMPALSVPFGTVQRDGAELPVGMQIMGPDMSENVLFKVGRDLLGEK